MSESTDVNVYEWQAPAWAQTSSQQDERIMYERTLAQIHSPETMVSAHLVQLDDVATEGTRSSVVRHPPYVRVAGECLSIEDAARLGRGLLAAAGFASSASGVGEGPAGA